VPTGDIETSEVAELSPLTFAVIVSGGTVGINRLEMRKAKYCTFSHSILYPVTPALKSGFTIHMPSGGAISIIMIGPPLLCLTRLPGGEATFALPINPCP
jgi:hypothetical protein